MLLVTMQSKGGRPRKRPALDTAFSRWLEATSMTIGEVMDKLSCGQSTVYAMACGDLVPGKELGWAIQILTQGAVPYTPEYWGADIEIVESEIGDQAHMMAAILADHVVRHHPRGRLGRLSEVLRQETILAWARVLQRIHDQGSTWGLIMSMIEWTQADEKWSVKVQSASGLKRHWAQIKADR